MNTQQFLSELLRDFTQAQKVINKLQQETQKQIIITNDKKLKEGAKNGKNND